MPTPEFAFSSQRPEGFAELIWNVFFAQRQRGVDLQTHFPWLVQPSSPGLWFASLQEADAPVACLVVKEVPGAAATAAIGLVCVHPNRRGQGLATRLLDGAIAQASHLGLQALTLWTGKPEVYLRHGFEGDDSGCLGRVSAWPAAPGRTPPQALQVRRWPDETELASTRRGLPPFASHAQRILADTGVAQAVIVFDNQGPALAEWRGADDAVMALLATTMPANWRLNALASDTLPASLSATGSLVELQPNRLQMWRTIAVGRRPTRPALRLLDRI